MCTGTVMGYLNTSCIKLARIADNTLTHVMVNKTKYFRLRLSEIPNRNVRESDLRGRPESDLSVT